MRAGITVTGPHAELMDARVLGGISVPLFAVGVPSLAWRDDGLMITVPTETRLTPPPGVIGWVAASSGAIYRFRGARIMNSVIGANEEHPIVVRFACRTQVVGDLILTEIAQMIEELVPIAQVFFLPVVLPLLIVRQDPEPEAVTLGQPSRE